MYVKQITGRGSQLLPPGLPFSPSSSHAVLASQDLGTQMDKPKSGAGVEELTQKRTWELSSYMHSIWKKIGVGVDYGPRPEEGSMISE